MWEGLPTKEWNRKIVERIVGENRGSIGEPFLIEPIETPVEYIEGKRYPFGEPAALPHVACVARFRSAAARDNDKDYSLLIVVWFQNEFGAMDSDVLQQLRTIDWEKLASDHEY
jgi:hypothetical protein